MARHLPAHAGAPSREIQAEAGSRSVTWTCVVLRRRIRPGAATSFDEKAVVQGHGVVKRVGRRNIRRRCAARRRCRGRSRQLHGHHGPVGLGYVDPSPHPRGPRPSDGGLGRDRRHTTRPVEGPRADAPASPPGGVRVAGRTPAAVLTAEENITLPLRIGGARVDREWLDAFIGAVGLGDRRKHRRLLDLVRTTAGEEHHEHCVSAISTPSGHGRADDRLMLDQRLRRPLPHLRSARACTGGLSG
ncbi:MAG: hypothetical protein QOD44_1751 [Solirubrobacteraceae bacterium]|nr:hypothetical protein [Solirubrobacteraceae bacterium]